LRLMGVPFEAALSATLLYRGFALWLPLGLGAILTRRTMRR
jgi:glycosyltransferase 2 family protein